MPSQDADQVQLLQANLRYLLNQWDPIGIAYLVDDEYDCMLVPLWSKLIEGGDRSSISEFLWYEIEDHFGMDPNRCGVDDFANKLVAWAASVTRCS